MARGLVMKLGIPEGNPLVVGLVMKLGRINL